MRLQFCSFLRLLIRRSYVTKVECRDGFGEGVEEDELEFAASCAGLAGNILVAHDNVTDDEIKYCFPYIHYLISATMVTSHLLSRHPSLKPRYDDILCRAMASLRMYCYKVWVSGKLMRTVSNLDAFVRAVLTDDGRQAKRQRSQRMEQSDSDTEPVDGSEWHHHSDAMEEEPEDLATRPAFVGQVAGNDDLRGEQQSMSLDSLSGHPRFPDSAMADFDFESIIMGSGNVPTTYSPDSATHMGVMYSQAHTGRSSIQGNVFPHGRMAGVASMYRPLIPQPNFVIQPTMPPETIDPYSTAGGGF